MKDNGLYMAVAVTEAVSGERGHGLAEAVAEGQGGAEGQGHGPCRTSSASSLMLTTSVICSQITASSAVRSSFFSFIL